MISIWNRNRMGKIWVQLEGRKWRSMLATQPAVPLTSALNTYLVNDVIKMSVWLGSPRSSPNGEVSVPVKQEGWGSCSVSPGTGRSSASGTSHRSRHKWVLPIWSFSFSAVVLLRKNGGKLVQPHASVSFKSFAGSCLCLPISDHFLDPREGLPLLSACLMNQSLQRSFIFKKPESLLGGS